MAAEEEPSSPTVPSFNPNLPPLLQGAAKNPQVAMMEKVMESCITKGLISGVIGFGIGGAFGTAMGMYNGVSNLFEIEEKLTVGQRALSVAKTMRSSAWSWSKNFMIVGGIFAGVECGIEKYRAVHDWKNPVAAGCVTGAMLAAPAGPQAACVGCVGFAIFSGIIEFITHGGLGDAE